MIERKKKGEEVEVETTSPTGEDMLQEVIKEPTLDVYLDRAPKLGSPINYPEMVGVLHHKRELFVTAEAKRKSGIKDEE